MLNHAACIWTLTRSLVVSWVFKLQTLRFNSTDETFLLSEKCFGLNLQTAVLQYHLEEKVVFLLYKSKYVHDLYTFTFIQKVIK